MIVLLALGPTSHLGCRPDQRHSGRVSRVPDERPVTTALSSAADTEGVAIRRFQNGGGTGYAEKRSRMVETQIRARGIKDARVLAAMEKVPRHVFVGEGFRDNAYMDGPLPIGHGQTISQPYIVALMTELTRPRAGARALDVGTGSGYQAAVLAELVSQVYSIEILCPLAAEAEARLSRLGYRNIEVRCGDGYRGWPEHAPFDVIIVAAAPDHIPQPLVDQLAPGGKMVLPVGDAYQDLLVIEKDPDGTVHRRSAGAVLFVPMTGEAERKGR